MPELILFFLSFIFVFRSFGTVSVYAPKLVNSKSGEHHDFPLGVLEATGRLTDGDRKILIMDVGKDGASPGCRACKLVVMDGTHRPGINHSDSCRRRMEKAMAKVEEGRE